MRISDLPDTEPETVPQNAMSLADWIIWSKGDNDTDGDVLLGDGPDRNDDELLEDLDLNDIKDVEQARSTLERIYNTEEIDYENDPEVDTAIRLDEIIRPLPA
jgi:hypothetical protein